MKKSILRYTTWAILFLIPITLVMIYGKDTSFKGIAYVKYEKPELQESAPVQKFLLKKDYQLLIDKLQANLTEELDHPNILKEDILRGWYLASKEEKKYGTPEEWVFLEAGKNSKWISPNFIEEEESLNKKFLCQQTGGEFTASCMLTTEVDCKYQSESTCECALGTKWKEGQGCLLVGEKGAFVSLNSSELNQGFYLGSANQKKLNTPADWKWFGAGENSSWRKN